jgi:glycosyltransferase involved in cell wall biosynthesis
VGEPASLWLCSGLQPGGAERNVVSVMPHLACDGLRVALCTLTRRHDGPLADEFARGGVRRFDLGARRLVDAVALGRLIRLVRMGRVDLIHAHDQDGTLLGALAGAATGVPVVISRHVLFEPAETRREALRARLVILAMRRRAARVIAVSEAVADSLAAAGVPRGRIAVIHNGIHQTAYAAAADRAECRRRLGWDDVPTILMPAVLRPGKGHEDLLAAMPAIRERQPRARVVLAGDGPSRRRVAAAAGAVDGVDLIGHRDDIPTLMGASDLVVLPSHAEGLPTVLIEAALAARPVVATRVGGAPEIVGDGLGGTLVPPHRPDELARAVIELLGSPRQAAALGSAARERARERFSLSRQADEMRRLYAEVLGR